MTLKEQYFKYSIIILILSLGVVIFVELIPFLGGLLGACTIYALIRNQMRHLIEKRNMKRSIAALLLILETILCFLIPISLVVWFLVVRVQNFNLDPQVVLAPIEQLSALIKQKIGYDILNTDNLKSVISLAPQIGQILMGGITSLALNIFVLIFVLYFMLLGSDKMENYMMDILPFTEKNKHAILHDVNMVVKSNAIGIPLLAIIQGAVAMLGYYIFNVPDLLLWGILTCFATVIPIIGTALIWFPLVIYFIIIGDWWDAIGLLIYSALIITHVDNLIRFILQKKMSDIHPLITIFGVIIGLPLFGFMGVIFGPLLLSIFILCVDIFKREYLEKSNSDYSVKEVGNTDMHDFPVK
ncbi:AI-2E family transporter [Coprobacter sp.]